MTEPVKVSPEFAASFKALVEHFGLDEGEEGSLRAAIRLDLANGGTPAGPYETVLYVAGLLDRCKARWGSMPTLERLKATSAELGCADAAWMEGRHGLLIMADRLDYIASMYRPAGWVAP